MYILQISLIVLQPMNFTTARELITDSVNPLQMPDPRTTITEQKILFRFRFSPAAVGDAGSKSQVPQDLLINSFSESSFLQI